mmetsp:Transcript_36227/g.117103  ORF Transcript_36227/g.117103 Transcript_36227/m.117103 type:complete len:275 (+) Transcript_36227:1819-2643(+)
MCSLSKDSPSVSNITCANLPGSRPSVRRDSKPLCSPFQMLVPPHGVRANNFSSAAFRPDSSMAVNSSVVRASWLKAMIDRRSLSPIMLMMVRTPCFAMSNKVKPWLSVVPEAPWILASACMEPETSMTQQKSEGDRSVPLGVCRVISTGTRACGPGPMARVLQTCMATPDSGGSGSAAPVSASNSASRTSAVKVHGGRGTSPIFGVFGDFADVGVAPPTLSMRKVFACVFRPHIARMSCMAGAGCRRTPSPALVAEAGAGGTLTRRPMLTAPLL